MRFEKKCGKEGCKRHNCCLVKVSLAIEKIPAYDLNGWFCPGCGEVQVEDGITSEVVENISNLNLLLHLYSNNVPTGKVAYADIKSGIIFVDGETENQKALGVSLPYYKNGIFSGGAYKANISLKEGTIGGLKPHLFLAFINPALCRIYLFFILVFPSVSSTVNPAFSIFSRN